MAYAEADDDIEVGVGLIQETGLEDGVAHCGTYLLAFGRDAHGGLHTGPLTVAFIFDFGTCYHYIVVAIFVIAFRSPERIFFREVRGQAEIRVCSCLELAVLSAAIYAA